MTELLPAKKDVALALLERSSVYVHLDPRRSGAVVPPSFKKQAQLVLQIGLNMAVAIPDLRFDEDGMSCTLSFSRSPFFCVVPWPAIFAMVGDDGRGMVWPDDVPREIQRSAPTAVPQLAPKPESPKRRRLGPVPAPALVDNGKSAAPKRRSKKKAAQPEVSERPRPQLVAVPSLPDDGPRQEARPARSKGRGAPAPEPAPAPLKVPPRARPTKPKRELPPYLRVVK